MSHAAGQFDNKSWDEKPLTAEGVAPKLHRAEVGNAYRGDIETEGSTVEYLLVYPEQEGAAVTFIGVEHITTTLAGRSGSFVLRHEGEFADGTVKADLTVVPGSGSGELAGLTGSGSFVMHMGKPAEWTLDYEV
ncbi:DUF3224 domain-containing protein [Streptomyces sp. NPDC058374]|uniref:DUF3224 domain-containing protein n=1 Tax=unclassified Streptomyces TaxID=2593676 RepID=UPI00364CD8A5